MEQEQIASRRPELPLRILHIIKSVGFLLNVPVVGIAGVKNLSPGRWGIKLGLTSFIVVVIVLAFVVDFVINVLDRIGEGVQVL